MLGSRNWLRARPTSSNVSLLIAVCWSSYAHVLQLFCVMCRKWTISWCCSCVLSVLSAAWCCTALLVYDLLCAENNFPLLFLKGLPSSLHFTAHLPLPDFFLTLIILHICSSHRPAYSMTPGLSPWRTNLAFHSGSKREVTLFVRFRFLCDFYLLSACSSLFSLWNVLLVDETLNAERLAWSGFVLPPPV